jgi:CHASE3 domain sensor protein
MWKQVLLPILFVVSLWVVMGGSTTFYMQWVDDSYQRVFRENLTSIRASDELQQIIWRLAGAWPVAEAETESFKSLWISVERDLALHEEQLRASSHTVEEQNALETLMKLISQMLLHVKDVDEIRHAAGLSENAAIIVSRKQVHDLAEMISKSTDELKAINERLIDHAAQRRARIGGIVLTSRLALMALGPLLGIWLG